MARGLNRLSARQVTSLKHGGRHSDGGGLYLRVTKRGARSWVFMTVSDGKRSEVGLGSAASVSLATARTLAGEMREAVALGKDPRQVLGGRASPEEVRVPTCIPISQGKSDKHILNEH